MQTSVPVWNVDSKKRQMSLVVRLLNLLSSQERKHTLFLLGMILVMALLDVIGIASIMPFIGLLANPQLVESNELLSFAFSYFEFEKRSDFIFFVGVAVFFLLLAALSFKALTTYMQVRFGFFLEYQIGKRLVEAYLNQPYSWFLNRNSADLGKSILMEVTAVVTTGLIPLMSLVAQSAVLISIFGLLLFVDPVLAISAGAFLSFAYLALFFLTSGLLSKIGEHRVDANEQRFLVLAEAFGAVKQIKLSGFEKKYVDRFGKPARTYAVATALATIIAQMPRFAFEAIAFGGMMLVVLYLMAKKGDFTEVLPVIALYAFAGYRLMPALQQIYSSLTQLRFVGPTLDRLDKDISSLQPVNKQTKSEPLTIAHSISLDEVSYTYPKSNKRSISNVSFEIKSGSTVAIVGATGSGKTTIVDIILGLIQPEVGSIVVDGTAINAKNMRNWQCLLAYVPQDIFLLDKSIIENIAFGEKENDIDLDAVIAAAKSANLDEFIINELEDGYNTFVGERGVRLSGGQRQRIGIARALYKKPKVLVLDEATSALDSVTEHVVMEAIENLAQELTTIIVAHRLSTVKNCDQIFVIEKGRLSANGSYDELLESDRTFKKLVSKT